MSNLVTDICVIGAGSAGLSVAAGAAQMGARVVLIEAGEMGGDCLNSGCVPSKALLAAAGAAQAQRVGGPGVAGQAPQIDYRAAMEHVAATIAHIAPHDSQERFEGLGCTVIRARASFVGPNRVAAGGQEITARRIVIATGSRPFVPPIPGLEDVPYLTNETLFALREAPRHLIVIGGGPIGLEMAQAHRRLGCEVTVIEAARALGQDDPDLAADLVASLRGEGIRILEHSAAEAVTSENGEIRVTTPEGIISGSHLLVAVGRRLNLDGLDLHKGQVAVENGRVQLEDSLRSVTNRRVYVIGDAAGGMQFTHLAGYHAGVIVPQVMFGLPGRAKTAHIPRVTYTAPELAQIGLTEAEARARHGDKLSVVTEAFVGNDRALTEAAPEGRAKLMVVGGRPVGVSLLGPEAGDLIAPWALLMAQNGKLRAMTQTVLPYPTRSEINKRLASAYFSPKLFGSPLVKRVVRWVQRLIP